MSQFYDKSSLTLIPSGYKDGKLYSQKPLSTDGELSFSRGSDIEATRVAANGYIEKAQVNTLKQSNTFNTTWAIVNSGSVASGQSGYDGTSDAWTLTKAANLYSGINQTVSTSGVNTFSIYAKAGTLNYLWVEFYAGGPSLYFNLSNGTITGSTGISASMVNVGNGFYRCSVAFNASITYINLYPQASTSPTTTAGTIYIQDAQLNYGLVAQTYQETTTAAVVSGITDNMPRLNYDPANPTCPSLLLEPSRQNLVESTEFFGASNWILSGSAITTNATTSPEGVANATKLEGDGSSVNVRLYDNYSYPSTGDYTLSVYAKAGTNDFVLMSILGVDGGKVRYFDLVNGIAGSADSKIEAIGTDGWYRCSFTATLTGPDITGNFNIYVPYSIDTTSFPTDADANGQYVYIYGAQLEQASYESSYIPTYGASATRNADACSKTGISSLIGQTEGTLFCDFNVLPSTLAGSYYLQTLLSDGTASNKIAMTYYADGRIQFVAFASGSLVVSINLPSYGLTIGKHKFAFAYKLNDYVAYVDGVSVGTDTSASVGAMSKLDLYDTSGGTNDINQVLLFTQRLSNSDLATLTSL